MSRRRALLAVLSAVAATAALVPALPIGASPAGTATARAGTIRTASMHSQALGGRIDYEIYLPPGYARSTAHYPTIYLLHGRGDTMQAWTREKADLDSMIDAGTIPPVIAVMPDAPWSDRASWYVDSRYTGGDDPGRPVETAFTRDLVKHVDATYRTVSGRWGRAVGGYSMGGAGALRFVLAHQALFSAALVLSPAVFTPLPPADDDVRNYGAFGAGTSLFTDRRYEALNYPALLPKVDPDLPVHVFLAVGDKEYVQPNPADAHHDLDFETAVAYNQLIRTPGVTADWRVLGGGHDWDVWQPAFVQGMQNLAGYLSTTKPAAITTPLIGTAGDDWAGGLVPRADGSVTTALAASGSVHGQPASGGLDAVVTSTDASGATAWTTEFGTAADERLYGAVDTGAGTTTVAGYTNGNLDGTHAGNSSGDVLVARLDAAGHRVWTTQFGDPAAADRAYAITADGAGGVYVAGYTKGSLGGVANAGDKDVLLARIAADGKVAWTAEFGGPGEDKAYALATSGDQVFVGGVTSAALPGGTASGGEDGWLAAFDTSGTRQWVRQLGTTADDIVQGLAVVGGTVVAVGTTGATIAGKSAGGTDAFAAGYAPDGTQRWLTQFGTSGDDGAATVVPSGGGAEVVGYTSGRFTAQVGGTDVFVQHLDADGSTRTVRQFGTAATDGVDGFGETNLAAAALGGTVWVTGDTYGSSTATRNAGGSDVFVSSLPAP